MAKVVASKSRSLECLKFVQAPSELYVTLAAESMATSNSKKRLPILPFAAAGQVGISMAACVHFVGMFLLLAHPHPARAQSGFISIDCGALNPSFDPNRSLAFEADNYISTGTAVDVSVRFALGKDYTFQELKTLRSFPAVSTPKKNCYEVPVETDRQYLVRASFYYGAYLPSPPSMINFQVALDSTVWTNVSIDSADNGVYLYTEAIYYTQKPLLSVCLMRTEDTSEPFISSLELRLLPPNGYLYRSGKSPSTVWLNSLSRIDVGVVSNDTTRYPGDPYDRLWEPLDPNSLPDLKSLIPISAMQGQQFSFDNTTDFPPNQVLQTALTNLTVINVNVGPFVDPVLYVSLFIAEVTAPEAGSSRVMDVTGNFLDGRITVDTSAQAPYSVYNVHNFNFKVPKDGNLTFVLQQSKASTPQLGPIVNGFELYSVGIVDNGTDAEEVAALAAIKNALGIEVWAGDPCFPVPYVWDYITCTSTHVTSIDLSNQHHNGLVPNFSALSTLKSLNLSDNKFTGPLPTWIGNLSSLTSLDVSNNQLSGTFPASYITDIPDFRYSKNLQLTCVSSPSAACPSVPGSPKKSSSGVIIGVVVGIILVVAVIITGVLLYCCWYKPKKQSHAETVPQQSQLFNIAPSQETVRGTRGKAQPFTLQTVKEATNNFARRIGEGGFGPVYFGILPNEQQVAVKVMSGKSQQGLSEFSNEIDLLSTVHYAKLVSLVGYCQEGKDLILLYEYMSGGDLRQRLCGPKASHFPLEWRQRLEIALDAAKGLEYLHHGCRPAIIHRDVKSSNILLTEKLEAKVADFGLSKLTDVDQEPEIMTVVKGTLGYLDPEYNSTGMLTDKSDVYSFGVVLLEILSGQPPITKDGPSSKFIVDKVRSAMNTGRLQAVADPGLGGEYKAEALWKLAEVGMSCVSLSAASRPGMTKVVAELVQVLETEVGRQVNPRWDDSSRSDVVTSNSHSSGAPSSSSTRSAEPPSQIFHQHVGPREL